MNKTEHIKLLPPMRKIYKYPLEIVDEQIVNVPAGAILLTVKVLNDEFLLFALVDESAPLKQRTLRICATWDEMRAETCIYLTTVIHNQFIWHIFEYFA